MAVGSTGSVTDVILEELELILLKRAHPSRVQTHTEAPARTASSPPEQTISDIRDAVSAAPDADAALMRARVAMLDNHVTGLALSGGGIRSGTFAVGFMQGLANLGLLGRFDYLSTVSGGGYAGGWLAAWLKREGDVKNVERQLDFSRIRQAAADREGFDPGRDQRPAVDEEPQPLRHLRSFSSYLFPNPGLLSADLWAVIMIWVRNVMINLLMLFPLAMLVVLVVRLVVFFYNDLNADRVFAAANADEVLATTVRGWWVGGFLLLGAAAGMLAFSQNAAALPEFRRPGRARPRNETRLALVVVIATVVTAFCLTVSSRWALWVLGGWVSDRKLATGAPTLVGNLIKLVTDHLELMELPSFLLSMGLFGAFMATGALLLGIRYGKLRAIFVLAAFVAGASGGFLFVLVLAMIRRFAEMNRPDLMATFAVPGAIGVVIASMIVEAAIAGRTMPEAEREWWGRYSARLAIFSVLWMAGIAATLYVPPLVLAGGAMARVAIASGWIGTTALGVLTGRFVLPRLQARGGGQWLARVATFVPPIFLAGLLGLVSLLASLVLNSPSLTAPNAADFPTFSYYLQGVEQTSVWLILAMMVGFGALAGLGFVLIDVNLFSLNAMYTNRLVRCYLGASRPIAEWRARWAARSRDMTLAVGAPSISRQEAGDEPMPPLRDPNPVTGFAPKDDLPLVELKIGHQFVPNDPDRVPRTYWGPHLLINTTLNLVAGNDLAWRSRKGESFFLSPLYCGSKTAGFVKVPDSGDVLTNLTLGRSIAISGAAVDPNMRFYQSRALTALLALFDARLGSWMQHPRDRRKWAAHSPRFGGLLLTELLGETDSRKPYVHLSDGGHFENMGVYELVRRRCRYIVALDAGDESSSSDSNLATLIRLCRIDFGIRIQIDTEALRPSGDEKLTRAHAVVGRIRYDDVDQDQLPGVLVYVKISMTGDEPPDLQNYARSDSKFPYQPTDLRQSFDEEQFESYRCLGDHIASRVFEGAVNRVRELGSSGAGNYVPRLFSALQGELDESFAMQDDDFVESKRAWIEIQRQLREDPALARLSRQLYPELPDAPTTGATAEPDYDRAEAHTVSQMLQIMENTWLSLGRRRLSELPMNRGWVNVFRRWVNMPSFQALWPVLNTEYGADFVRFCEDQLHLRALEPRCIPLDDPDADRRFQHAAVARLAEEHAREWPGPAVPKVGELIERARALNPEGGPPVWLIVQEPTTPRAAEGDSYVPAFVLGIILAAKLDDLTTVFPGVDAAGDGVPVEFFVWMRRGFRSANLGAPRVRDVLTNQLGPALGLGSADSLPTLWARYPKRGEHGDDDNERTVWLNFLARFDFRPLYPKQSGAWNSTLLRR